MTAATARGAGASAPIAFIGLGAMGAPMARNLLARGFAVRGYDVRGEAVDALATAGGIAADSVRAACAGSKIAVLMVVNAAQAEQVLFAEGAVDALADGGIVVLMATCPPGAVAAIASRVLERGRCFVDAPVSGGVVGAEAATLTIMAAAPRATLDAVADVLAALGRKVARVGVRPGQGAMVKAVNQLLCGVHLAVAGEALSLAAKVGVDLEAVLDIVGGSAAASWMLNDRGPRMLEDTPRVTSAVDIFVKDLGIVLEAGREAQAALPLAAIAHQMFLSVAGRGYGKLDDSQVVRAYRALNGGDSPA